MKPKRPDTDLPTGGAQPEAKQAKKGKGGAPAGNRNAVTSGLHRKTKRTRAVNEDAFDRAGRYAAAELYDKGDPRRKVYAGNFAAWLRLKSRLDARGWTLANGEVKNAVTVWESLGKQIEKMQGERRREQDGAPEPAGHVVYRARFAAQPDPQGLRPGVANDEDPRCRYCQGCGHLVMAAPEPFRGTPPTKPAGEPPQAPENDEPSEPDPEAPEAESAASRQLQAARDAYARASNADRGGDGAPRSDSTKFRFRSGRDWKRERF